MRELARDAPHDTMPHAAVCIGAASERNPET
jgi:hypothetical protein